jgi:glyoxylase-like metal-dependent hydrolase (beta-lactamase superfamily II)
MSIPEVTGFLHPGSSTISYVVADPATRICAVIDSALDYDAAAGRTGTGSADAIAAFVAERELTVAWQLETHVHADHLSAMAHLRRRLGGCSGVGGRIADVQAVFARLFNIGPGFEADGRQFAHLFQDGETFAVGTLTGQVIETPGHTPACVSYLIGDALFVGDTLFMPDSGTARCDFPGGDAATLYRSIQRLYQLPGETRLFVCHDYAPGGRAPQWQTTIADQRAHNIHLRAGTTEAEFVALRTARDATLAMPALILPSVQINIRAGQPPEPEANGVSYLKIPLDSL